MPTTTFNSGLGGAALSARLPESRSTGPSRDKGAAAPTTNLSSRVTRLKSTESRTGQPPSAARPEAPKTSAPRDSVRMSSEAGALSSQAGPISGRLSNGSTAKGGAMSGAGALLNGLKSNYASPPKFDTYASSNLGTGSHQPIPVAVPDGGGARPGRNLNLSVAEGTSQRYRGTAGDDNTMVKTGPNSRLSYEITPGRDNVVINGPGQIDLRVGQGDNLEVRDSQGPFYQVGEPQANSLTRIQVNDASQLSVHEEKPMQGR